MKGVVLVILAFLVAYSSFSILNDSQDQIIVELQESNHQHSHAHDHRDFSSKFPFLRTSFTSRALEVHEVDYDATASSYSYYHDNSPFSPRDLHEISKNEFVKENKRAIALISFGELALSPLLEQAIMSIRRKGMFYGPIMVITNAALERYEGLFDENVYLVNSKKRDMKEKYFSRPEMSFKRFKTLILDYITLLPDLDDVQFIYYMDIDVMMGAPFLDLVQGLQQKYGIENEPDFSDQDHSHHEPISTLFFFRNFPESHMNYFACSGFFVMNRLTSTHCLDLWREEIDLVRYRSMDQKSLTILADRIRDGEITQCRMTVMDLEEYIKYPVENVDLLEMIMFDRYPNLIHVFHTGAEGIDEDTMKFCIANVLELTLQERTEKFGKFGRYGIQEDYPSDFVNTTDVTKSTTATIIGTRMNEAAFGHQQQQMHAQQSGMHLKIQQNQKQQQQQQQQNQLQKQEQKQQPWRQINSRQQQHQQLLGEQLQQNQNQQHPNNQNPQLHYKQQLQNQHKQQQKQTQKIESNFTLNNTNNTALMTTKSFARMNLNITPGAEEPHVEVKRSMWEKVMNFGV